MYDFRRPRRVGTDYIDINYVLSDAYEYAAKVTDPEAGISMSVKTSFPGLQLYNGNYIGNCTGKYNLPYNNQHGICFEPQFFLTQCIIITFHHLFLKPENVLIDT